MSALLVIARHGDKYHLRRANGEDRRARHLGAFNDVDRALREAHDIIQRSKRYENGADEVRVLKERRCLCCPALFQSEGAHHRMCNSCRTRVSDAGIY